MTRPTKNVIPQNHARCLICGSCWEIGAAGRELASDFRDFLSEHRDCRILGAPAACCVVDGCLDTALGPMQKCTEHGGRLSKADVTAGDRVPDRVRPLTPEDLRP